MDIEPAAKLTYEVERILRWRKVQIGRKKTMEFLVTWHGYPLEEPTWALERNFPLPNESEKVLKQDKPVEDHGSGSSS